MNDPTIAPDPDEGLQDERDESEAREPRTPEEWAEWGEWVDDESHPITGDPPSWRDRYDREEEWRGER